MYKIPPELLHIANTLKSVYLLKSVWCDICSMYQFVFDHAISQRYQRWQRKAPYTPPIFHI